jgi:hypothetical protein
MAESIFYGSKNLVGVGNVGIGTATTSSSSLTVQAPNNQATFADLSLNTPNSKKFSILYQDPNGGSTFYWSTFLGKSLSTDGTNFTFHSDGSNRFMSAIELGNAGINFYSNLQQSATTDQTGISMTAFQASKIMTIQAINGGRVGVGTPSPANKFHVYTGVSGNVASFVSFGGSGSTANVDIATYLNASNVPNTRISVIDDGAYSGHFTIQTKTTGSETNVLNERFRITSAGSVGIGTTGPATALDVYGTNTGNSFLNAQAIGNSGGTLYLYSNSANGLGFFVQGVGKFYVNANAMSPWTDNNISLGSSGGRYTAVWAVNGAIQTSDSRFKDSTPLNYGLNEILQANTILYSWKTQASLPDTDPEKNFKYFGVCADELVNIMPELCYNENPDAPVQINYSELMPVCINAIKELSTRLQTAQNDIDLLESRLAAIEALISTNTSADTTTSSTGTRADSLLAEAGAV